MSMVLRSEPSANGCFYDRIRSVRLDDFQRQRYGSYSSSRRRRLRVSFGDYGWRNLLRESVPANLDYLARLEPFVLVFAQSELL